MITQFVKGSKVGGRGALRAAASVVLLTLCATGAFAQEAPSSVVDGPAVSAQAILGPGDTIKIASLSSEELSKEWRVGETGRLHLPLIGAVDVSGMTVAALQAHL